MSEQDIYVVIDRKSRDSYVSSYNTRLGHVAVSELFIDAIKFGENEAEEVAEYFGMMILKVTNIYR